MIPALEVTKVSLFIVFPGGDSALEVTKVSLFIVVHPAQVVSAALAKWSLAPSELRKCRYFKVARRVTQQFLCLGSAPVK